tara:strand:+ start:5625 stop:5840 length:216 start_codon:yes stop_codon:yes gene_type:complete
MQTYLLFFLLLCYIFTMSMQVALIWLMHKDSKRRDELEKLRLESDKSKQWDSFDMYQRDSLEAAVAGRRER